MALSNNYRMAITEVLEILNNVEINEYNRIPKKIITFLEEQKDPNYIFSIKPNQEFEELKIMDETKGFLSLIYYSYLCNTDEEKRLYLMTLNYNERKFQDELMEKYNYNNIFNDRTEKNKNSIDNSNINNQNENQITQKTEMIKYSKNPFMKFINFFKQLFKKKI